MKTETKIISFQIDCELFQQVKAAAKADSRSVSNWINCAIIENLKKEGGKK